VTKKRVIKKRIKSEAGLIKERFTGVKFGKCPQFFRSVLDHTKKTVPGDKRFYKKMGTNNHGTYRYSDAE
jgi:hypothetical protein